MCRLFLLFFFFKQKTAYEMRISDWSSDVCSSDLYAWNEQGSSCGLTYMFADFPDVALVEAALEDEWQPRFERAPELAGQHLHLDLDWEQIGRASCRERVCQYV